MRLVHITTVAESLFFLAGQVRWMESQGIDVHAISSPGDMLIKFGEQECAGTHPVCMTRKIDPIGDLKALLNIVRELNIIKPQIVHSHTPKGGLLGMIASRMAGVGVKIYHVHGLPFMTATGVKRAILRVTEKISCSLADQVLCVSQSIKNVLVTERLCPESKVKVLMGGSINGIDAEVRFNPDILPSDIGQITRRAHGIPESALLIGFVGRIVRDKGIGELILAWKSLRKEYSELYLILIGPFEPQDPISSEAIKEIHNDPRIISVGMNWNTPPLYAAMDLVVLPTYREGFPTVPLEAAAMKLPIVATTVPGCTDAIIDGVTGILVPPRCHEALSKAIKRYLDDPELRLNNGLAGRERVLQEYDQERIWKALYAEYERLLGMSNYDCKARI